MSCQDCLNRREFLAKSAAAAAALVVVEGCGDGQIGPTAATPTGGSLTIRVADFPALANTNTVVAISVDRALVRTNATTFQAFSMICTHEGCLTDVNTRSNRLECPCHGSIFSATGAVLVGPANRSLDKLNATFDSVAGTVTVT